MSVVESGKRANCTVRAAMVVMITRAVMDGARLRTSHGFSASSTWPASKRSRRHRTRMGYIVGLVGFRCDGHHWDLLPMSFGASTAAG